MEKYRLVQEHKADESDEFLDHPAATGGTGATATSSSGGGSASTDNFPEVRITQQGKPRNYISHAMNIFVRVVSSFIPFHFILFNSRETCESCLLIHSFILIHLHTYSR
jgi:hypothetical protein